MPQLRAIEANPPRAGVGIGFCRVVAKVSNAVQDRFQIGLIDHAAPERQADCRAGIRRHGHQADFEQFLFLESAVRFAGRFVAARPFDGDEADALAANKAAARHLIGHRPERIIQREPHTVAQFAFVNLHIVRATQDIEDGRVIVTVNDDRIAAVVVELPAVQFDDFVVTVHR